MNPVEERISAATRAAGATVREVRRPLRLPSGADANAEPGPGSGSPARRARHWKTWLAPATAAAAVVALAASLVLIRDIPNGRVVSPPGPTPATSGVPRYYAALIPQGKGITWNEVIVNDTITGARLATVRPAHGSSFGVVTAAADDRTFVVAASPMFKLDGPNVPNTWWYLLRIAPGTSSPARLTRLAIPELRGQYLYALALSRSGRELAVGYGGPQSMRSPVQLRIYSVTTGRLERAWTTRDKTVMAAARDGFAAENTALTWVDSDRALAFPTLSLVTQLGKQQEVTHETLRLIDKSAAGGDLIAASRVIWSGQSVISLGTAPDDLSCTFGNPMLAANGKTIVCAVAAKHASPPRSANRPPDTVRGRWTLRWLAYPTSAPTVARTVAQLDVDAPESNSPGIDLLWTDSSGGTLIGEWSGGSFPGPNPPPADRSRWGVIADGKFLPLTTVPDMNYIVSIAW
jgi:hypothetical protein